MNEDLIRRSDVLNLATCITKPTYDSPYCESVVYVEDIEAIPSVEVEPVRHGEWVKDKERNTYCSCCNAYIPTVHCHQDYQDSEFDWEEEIEETNYCPNCGTKMDGGTDNGK